MSAFTDDEYSRTPYARASRGFHTRLAYIESPSPMRSSTLMGDLAGLVPVMLQFTA